MRRFLFLLPLLILAFPNQVAKAQTPQHTIAWNYANETAATVNSFYNQTVVVNGTTITTATVRPTCVQAGLNVNCTIAVGTLAPDTGHTVSVSATRDNVTATTNITNLRFGSAPKNPTDFRYQIQINVNLP